MRILVVATHIKLPDTHGGSTHVRELVSHLREHAPTLLLARTGSQAPDTVGVGFWRKLPPRGFAHLLSAAYFRKSLAAAKSFAPTVIYERGSSYGLGTMLSKALRIPMICMVLDEHYSSWSLRHASRIITTKPELVPQEFQDKIVRVGWGANTKRFNPNIDGQSIRTKLGIPNEDYVVAYTGSFAKWHDLHILFDVADRLRIRKDELRKSIRFLLIGDGGQRPIIEAEAKARGLADQFIFSGKVPYEEVANYVAAADLCVAPFNPNHHSLTKKHGFALDPLKVFEYMAMAKPTITIDAANIRGLFNPGEHIELFPPGDAEALTDRVCEHITDPKRSAEIGRAGMDRVVNNHTWARHAQHLVEIFTEISD